MVLPSRPPVSDAHAVLGTLEVRVIEQNCTAAFQMQYIGAKSVAARLALLMEYIGIALSIGKERLVDRRELLVRIRSTWLSAF